MPKKEAERRRRNKDAVETEVINLDELIAGEVTVPKPDPDWEPLTRSFYDSFKASGQAIWMEPSDWMTAYALMEVLDRWLKPQEVKVGEYRPGAQEGGEVEYRFEDKILPMPGSVLTGILKGLSALMATEGDRRRLRIELERKKAVEAALGGNVVSISKTREDRFKRNQEASDG